MLFLLSLPFLPLNANDLAFSKDFQGAWERQITRDGGDFTQMLLFSGSYFTWTEYRTSDGAFQMTKGGSWSLEGKALTLQYEFDTADPDRVGTSETMQAHVQGKKLALHAGEKMSWKAVDAGMKTPLTGPWLFSGRRGNDGEIRRRSTDGPRKTMKILTGTRFQWIAYNVETKEFFGTGGGTYTAENGRYTEHIGFFSRDDSRVGASLGFDFEVKGNDWHHSGFSSKGDPMYEIWSRRP